MPNPDEHKGIQCPNPDCGAVDSYKGGQNKKLHEHIVRNKECKICGTIFKTVEAPVGVVEFKNNHTAT
jgi:hypothetical protein